MSVLECDRINCGNIMCDRVSHDRGEYICNECFEELVELGPTTDLDDFMDSPKRRASALEASRAYFDAIFPDRT